jgi:hypothetical protein
MQPMMAFLEAMRWDLVADGLQVLMCGVILLCLLRNQLRYQRLLPPASQREKPPLFSQEVLLQTLRQQAEQALASIRAAVDAEEAKLQQILSAAGAVPAGAGNAAAEAPGESIPFRLGGGEPAGFGVPPRSRYVGLAELAAQGLTLRQMAAQTRLPAGEIELALKLQRASAEPGSTTAARQ